jgi:hypothetical protein
MAAKEAVSSQITSLCRSEKTHMNPQSPAVSAQPRMILMLEGAALFALCIFAYAKLGHSWWLFGALILAPDIGMIGYLRDAKTGAWLYNALHLTALPIALGVCGYLWSVPLAIPLALIWLAHIGMDRMLGYGLKYESGFTDTHLGRIGKEN